MKPIPKRILLLVSVLLTAIAAIAYDFKVDGIYYNKNSDGTSVSVTYSSYNYGNYGSYSGSVIIPEQVTYSRTTYSVTSIGYRAFYGCSGLTSVSIPNSVTEIGNYAFYGCSGLTSVTIPNSVTKIGESAFCVCSGLTSVTIPNSVTSIGGYAFSGCSGLTSVTIPNSVTKIGTGAFTYTPFYNNQPDGIVYINDVLYKYKGTMPENTSIEIREGTVSISNYAFYECSGLTSLTIPNSVTEIGDSAFSNCSRLTSATFNAENCILSSSWLSGCTSITSFEIGSDVKILPANLCYGLSRLTSIAIPNSVTSIGDYAFYGCSGLVNITLPKSVTSIGASAFANCYSLNSVVFGAGLTSISSDAFSECSIKKAFWLANTPPSGSSDVSATVHYVANDQYSFSNQTKYQFLSSMFTVDGTVYVPVSPSERTCDVIDCTYSPDDKDITIAETVTNKGISLTVVTVKPFSHIGNPFIETASISHNGTIGYSAFQNCTALQSATISNQGDIGNYAFRNCTALQSAAVSNVGSVGEYAFDGCTNLQELTLTNEGDVLQCAFQNTGSIANLTIANKGNLEAYAFQYSKLQNVTVANEGTVGASAFSGCSLLQTASISNQGSVGASAFSDCSSLASATLGEEVSSIGEEAFYNCSALGEIVIPDAVTTVGTSAFEGCAAVANVSIGKGVHSLPQRVFYGCSSLPSLTIPNYVASVADYAFSGCTALSDLTIGDGEDLLTLGSNGISPLFVDCPLDEVYIGRKLSYSKGPSNGYSPFYNNAYLRVVEFNDAENTIYANEFSGCRNLNSIKIGNNISSIGEEAFYNCSALGEIVIPDAVTTVGASAFRGCAALENVSIGKGVTSLPQRVFYGCSSLPSLTIPNNVASVGSYAFSGCSALSDLTIEDAEESEPVEDEQQEERQQLSFDDWTSTNHNNSSSSYKEYSFIAAVGDVLTFNYSVSSESSYDFLIIKLNGTQIVKESGTKSGSYRKEFTEAGSVTLYLSYTKDSSNSSGSDQATVTDIRVNDVQTVDSSALTLGANGSSPLFADCPLDEVYIGRKLNYSTASDAGYSPFYRNTSLRAVEITDAETQIYDNEFYGCTNLQTLKIGNGVKTIGNWAFSGCSSLEYFSAGFEVESIGQEAFSDCTGLTNYYSYSVVPPTCGDQALDDINKWECTLYIPTNSADEYMAADQWKEFFFLSEMDAVLVAEILLNCNEFVLTSDDTFQLTAEVLPVNVTDPRVVWSSSNPEVATVDDNGLVTAVYEGTATITATSADGNAMATADVEVKINTGIEDVTIDGTADIEVYNAAGVKMGTSLHNLVPGVYFVRQGTTITKVVVK